MADLETGQVVAEGGNIADAVKAAAVELGVAADLVEHKIDASHFRNAHGGVRPVDTVKIIAWAQDATQFASALAGQEWLKGLIDRMGFENKVAFKKEDDVVRLKVDSPEGRFLVGRRGTTLRAIQAVVNAALEDEYPDVTYKIDVLGGRNDRDRDRGDRDRGGRDRDRDRDRGDRRGGRDRDDRRRKRGDRDVEELKKLAFRLADKVKQSGKSEKIRKELNSFERRHVHMALADFDGVETQSVGEGNAKQILIVASEGASEE